MKKSLISQDTIVECIENGNKEVYIDKNTIITPLAKLLAEENSIAFVDQSKNLSNSNKKEDKFDASDLLEVILRGKGENKEDVKKLFDLIFKKDKDYNSVPVGISGRHVHLSKTDIDKLFGQGYELQKCKDLKQTGQFLAKERIALSGPKGIIENVGIIGPARKDSQVEILMGDTFKLGVPGMVRLSGEIEETPGLTLIGPSGAVVLEKGVILSKRHLHINTCDLERYNLTNGQIISVEVNGIRGGILNNIEVRATDSSVLELHIDMEEANAFGISNGDFLKIIR